jgi:uncharacterized membrane protein YjjB (DUF3815 family)
MNMLTILEDALWSAVAGVGFAMLFSIPRRLLLACAVCAAVGHAARSLVMFMGLSIEAATLVGAMLVGFMGALFARRWKVPSPIFTITGTIPMVPGVFAYRAMIGFISIVSLDAENGRLLLVEASTDAIKTGLILAAIALGIALPKLLFSRPKPVV